MKKSTSVEAWVHKHRVALGIVVVACALAAAAVWYISSWREQPVPNGFSGQRQSA